MALRNDGITPNRTELRVRTACGFVFGALMGGLGIAQWFEYASAGVILVAALLGGLLGALLARHYGDRFWASVGWWG